jgi:adenylate kinase family enzyme
VRTVVLLGRGAAGKSTLARQLGEATGRPVVELDKLFWKPDLTPTPPDEWAQVQRELAQRPGWIADGDLGPYDVLDVRLAAADTVVLLDFPLVRCAWRALRRSRERSDFWRWVITWRRVWRPRILARVAAVAPDAQLHVLRSPRAVREFLAAAGG